MFRPTVAKQNGVFIASEIDPKFSDAYLKVRSIEDRVYSDITVLELPNLDRGHQQYSEWQMRKKSAERFGKHLKNNQFETLLEVGCGNGWFTNYCSRFVKSAVGLDINLVELEQGAKLFRKENLEFVYWDIFKSNPLERKVDVIVLNASVQYFNDAKLLFNRLEELLNNKGEIHIIDSPFYSQDEIGAAQERTKKYYQEKGTGEMLAYYNHHLLKEVDTFDLMYKPSKNVFLRLLKGKDIPFGWYKRTYNK